MPCISAYSLAEIKSISITLILLQRYCFLAVIGKKIRSSVSNVEGFLADKPADRDSYLADFLKKRLSLWHKYLY